MSIIGIIVSLLIIIVLVILAIFLFVYIIHKNKIPDSIDVWIKDNLIDCLSSAENIGKDKLQNMLSKEFNEYINKHIKNSKIIYNKIENYKIEVTNLLELETGKKVKYTKLFDWDDLPDDIREEFIMKDSKIVEKDIKIIDYFNK